MKSAPTCPKCGSAEFVTASLPRDWHTHICSNHAQDLFFTPRDRPRPKKWYAQHQDPPQYESRSLAESLLREADQYDVAGIADDLLTVLQPTAPLPVAVSFARLLQAKLKATPVSLEQLREALELFEPGAGADADEAYQVWQTLETIDLAEYLD